MKKAGRKRHVLGDIEKDILNHLTAGDHLLSFLMSAGSTRALYREAYKRARARYHCRRSIEGLERKGMVKRRNNMFMLTEKGKELAEILSSRSASRRDHWKERWWVVMYDIPVSLNTFRFELRRILIRAGFRKLQHSVWIHPHPCKELELFMQRNPRLARYIRYAEMLPFPHMRSLVDWNRLGAA